MTDRFHSFVILAGMRTGSNFLEANLNALDGITCYGEIFNPHFVGRKKVDELFGITLAQRDINPKALLEKIRSETIGLSGFRLFHDHDNRILRLVLADPGCAKIILTRNPVDSYVSLQIARATGQWKLSDAKRLKSAFGHFDEDTFRSYLMQNQAFHLQILRALQTSGQTAFVLDYEDLGSVEVLNGLAAYLGIPARLARLDETLKKQNPGTPEEKLDNPEALIQATTQADFFGLARTPISEPRRPVNVHEALAVDEAGLLFFPIKSSVDGDIRQWLSGLGQIVQGFNPKSLWQWKRDHPGHRSFTVIRHPLLRAYQAFHSKIVGGELPHHRLTLVRAYKAKLPSIGEPFADIESEKRAFLIFLHYARLSVNGQCGQRVDANWASQTAMIQSIAAFHPLDFVIREDDLGAGLAALTAGRDIGTDVVPSTDRLTAGLAKIYDDRVEAAGAAAYARDYAGFGFTRWRDQAA